MHELLETIILPAFRNEHLTGQTDSAVLPFSARRLAFTTDSFVVRPMFFPGGDVGSLAVHGTVNDLAMSGARPLWLSAGLIIEEGLSIETLNRIVQSMRRAAEQCGVKIVTGDTKVVERGKGDEVYINTAGVGVIEHELVIAPASARSGDVILINGDIGRHGMAVMAAREGLSFETTIESDSAPLVAPALALLAAGVDIRCMRDLTRGGLTSCLNEIAAAAGLKVEIDQSAIPVRSDVSAACELLGLDAFQVACEGRFAAIVARPHAERALVVLKQFDPAAAIAGEVTEGDSRVILRTALSRRILDMPAGEQLPRIC
jgi:hydrogenase expression/formation protein HypE